MVGICAMCKDKGVPLTEHHVRELLWKIPRSNP